MHLAYFDESGDDGYPLYSSPVFVLASLYISENEWKNAFQKIREFRGALRKTYKLPVKMEFHTAEFICDKNPYHGMFGPHTRRDVIFEWAKFIATLPIKSIMVAIDKSNIENASYDILQNALKYNVQRIENDLSRKGSEERFIIITDEGRVGKMRSTTREIQKINYIQSQYGPDKYRRDIAHLLEDPLPKSSDQSYFIQLADFLAFVCQYYVKCEICQPSIPLGKRYMNALQNGDHVKLMNILTPILNTRASSTNVYGVVVYPKK